MDGGGCEEAVLGRVWEGARAGFVEVGGRHWVDRGVDSCLWELYLHICVFLGCIFYIRIFVVLLFSLRA